MSLVSSLRSAVVPTRSSRPYVRQHKYHKASVDAYIDEGMRMEVHMQKCYGTEDTTDFMQQSAGANCGRSMPYGFYPAYCDEVLEPKYTIAKRIRFAAPYFYTPNGRRSVGLVPFAFGGTKSRAAHSHGRTLSTWILMV